MNKLTIIFTLITLLSPSIVLACNEPDSGLTYCTNGRGEVVIVDDYHCPSGFYKM